jgi:hypothetical protein
MTDTDPDRARRVASDRWPELIAEAESILEGYVERGWETLLVRPGDVTPVSERERPGLDLVVPGNEYEPLAEWVEERGVEFPTSEVYSREERGVVLLVVAVLDPDAEVAVAFPAYYDREDGATDAMFDRASEEGSLATYLRRLDGETVVFSHEDPSIFGSTGP